MTTRPARRLLALLALASAPGIAPACAQQPVDPTAGAATITAEDIVRRVGVIAHDSMKGRDTPSPELDRTAEWVSAEVRRLGLRAGGDDGGFVQRYPLRSVALDAERSSLVVGAERLRFGDDLAPLFGEVGAGEAVGELVVVSGSGTLGLGDRRAVRDRHVAVVPPTGADGAGRGIFGLVAAIRGAGARSVLVADGSSDAVWGSRAARALRQC